VWGGGGGGGREESMIHRYLHVHRKCHHTLNITLNGIYVYMATLPTITCKYTRV